MGYNTSNAALAYDMNAMPAYRETPQAPVAPREQRTPRFDVYTGAGRQANQAVSPVFMSVPKTFCIIAAIFMDDRCRPRGARWRYGPGAQQQRRAYQHAREGDRRELRPGGHAFGLWCRHTHSATLRALMAWWSPARALHLIFRRMQPRALTRPRPLSNKTVAEYDK